LNLADDALDRTCWTKAGAGAGRAEFDLRAVARVLDAGDAAEAPLPRRLGFMPSTP
jgi:hypothetical protein